jgi:phospholipase/carboxylesterase
MELQLPLRYIWQPSYVSSRTLVVVLHGLGDSAEGFRWFQDELAIDSLNLLLLDAPNHYYTGYSWYDSSNRLPGILESRRILDEVFARLEQQGYSPDRTFLLGFSQGCLMTLEFGARYRRALGGYVGISGYSHNPEKLLRELNPEVNQGNWLVTHGTQDEILAVERTRKQMQTLNAGGFRIDYREYEKSHTVDLKRELPDIREWITVRLRE